MQKWEEACDRLNRFVERRMRQAKLPGVVVAVTDRRRTLRVSTYGFADIAARAPLTARTQFQIGSIGKSFTSIALLQLQEAGRVDLHAPVTQVLPWFRVRSPYAPITLHHLLTHSAGIINGSDITSDSRFEVFALRDTEAASPPGKHYYYSNVGYRVLGTVLEDVAGQPYADIIRTRILDPLGMVHTEPAITHDTRRRLAVGYLSLFDDRPERPAHALVPATWFESNTADGCISSTADDMAVYVRMLLNRGRGPRGPIVSEASFALLAQRAIESEDGGYYGYGLDSFDIDGRACLGHGGGMVGYSTGMRADLDAGFGVVVMVNKTNAFGILPYAFELMGAALDGRDLPPLPADDPTRVENAAEFAGVYRSGDKAIEISAEGDQVILKQAGERITLEKREPDRFFVPHADFERFLLIFRREAGRVVEAFHGPDGYVNEHDAGPTTFDAPPEWSAYVGHYRSYNPWLSNFRIVLRKGNLVLIYPDGEEKSVIPLREDVFRVGQEEWSPERIHFDAVVDGQALRANLSGCDYYRTFTP